MAFLPLTLETLRTLPEEPPHYFVLGDPIAHSRSPQMQNAAFAHYGMSARYERLQVRVEEFPDVIDALRARRCPGWNCTIPHKLAMMAAADQLAESARRLGSVNAVVNDNGVLVGHCTDGLGWSRAVREAFGVEVSALRILILGTGGAGQALARQAAGEKCAQLFLANRTYATAQALATELKEEGSPVAAVPWEDSALREAVRLVDLVVNSTSVGLKKEDPSALPGEWLRAGQLVYDTVYTPTKLQEVAQAAGCKTSAGLGMLLHQGAAAFELWTGKPAPLEVMRAALNT